MRAITIIAFLVWLLLLLWFVGGDNLHGGQLELRSDVPVEAFNRVSLTDDIGWQSLGTGMQWQLSDGAASNFIRLAITNTVVRVKWADYGSSVIGYVVLIATNFYGTPIVFKDVGAVTNCGIACPAQPHLFVTYYGYDSNGDTTEISKPLDYVVQPPILQKN